MYKRVLQILLISHLEKAWPFPDGGFTDLLLDSLAHSLFVCVSCSQR